MSSLKKSLQYQDQNNIDFSELVNTSFQGKKETIRAQHHRLHCDKSKRRRSCTFGLAQQGRQISSTSSLITIKNANQSRKKSKEKVLTHSTT